MNFELNLAFFEADEVNLNPKSWHQKAEINRSM